jgi:two-component system chemotaxis sensor kinase CheA
VSRDPELTQILVQELERHLGALENADLETSRRTVHALKGSAGLAGEPELAAAMQRLERRLRDGDVEARAEVITTVTDAIQRIRSGAPAAGAWPEPPPDLAPSALDPLVRAQYAVEVNDRLARIDAALASGDQDEAAAEIFRHVHTMKGASSAVGDEPMTWFCHGLEERLRLRTSSAAALEEVAGWRAVLGALVDDPEAALATLRGVPLRPRRTTQRPSARMEPDGDGTVRVAAQAIDSLFDHAAGITEARERVAARSKGALDHARQLRRLRGELVEALRLIGPPRPWGAPAAALRRVEQTANALGATSEELEAASSMLQNTGQALRDDIGASKKILATMRQTPIRGLFTRLANAVMAEARRAGRSVVVRQVGADELVDRRLVEALAEPCLQLARNAIAHGIEASEVRAALGKPNNATLTFSASRRGNRLSIAISDDGAGVDVAAVRMRAVDAGVVTDTLARAADDQTLLELLFLPGFSTQSQSPNLLAGRGIGLDITLASVQRLGGSIRLSTALGEGFEARVDVPIESGLVTVLWVSAGGFELAIPATNAQRVRAADHEIVPHLASCLEPPTFVMRAKYFLDLESLDDGITVGVDAIGATEEVLLRPLSPLLAGIGPYAGGIVRGDGTIRLAIDVHALAPRARALGRVGPPSDIVSVIT